MGQMHGLFWKAAVIGMLLSAARLSCQNAAVTVSGPPLDPALQQAIHDYDAAQWHGDRVELERLVATDYLIVRPRGLADRASLINGMAHPGMKMEPFTVLKPFTRNYGDTVVTGGWADLKGIDDGKPFEEKFRFSDVWSKRNGRWFVVMTQLTPSETP